MDRVTFDAQLGRLAVLPGMPSTSDAHWEALQDIPESIIDSAIGHALKTRRWFPVPVELRQDADAVKPRQAYQPPTPKPTGRSQVVTIPNPFGGKGITVTVTDAVEYCCQACSDTGWEAMWCGPAGPQTKPWHEFGTCERRGVHPPHEFVRKCACWATNEVLVRKREAQASYAAQRAEAKR